MEEGKVTSMEPAKSGLFKTVSLWMICLVLALIAIASYGLFFKSSKSPFAIYSSAFTKNLYETSSTVKAFSDINGLDVTAKYSLADTLNDTIVDLSQGSEFRSVVTNGKVATSTTLLGLPFKSSIALKDALGIKYSGADVLSEVALNFRNDKNFKNLSDGLTNFAKEKELKLADKINEKAIKQATEIAIKFDREIAKKENFNKVFKNYSKANGTNGTTYSFDFEVGVLVETLSEYMRVNYDKYPELKALLDAMVAEDGEYQTFDTALIAEKDNIAEAYEYPISISFTIDKKGFLGKTTVKYIDSEFSFEFSDVGTTKIDRTEIESFIKECEDYKFPFSN